MTEKPLKIKGTINYTLEITSEGYQIEVVPNTADDLACVLIAKDIVERFQVDMRHAKTLKTLSGDAKKVVADRLTKMNQTSYGLMSVAEQVIKYILSETKKKVK